MELDSLWWAFGLQHQVSRALQDIILHQATDLCKILRLCVQRQTGILRSAWEHAIGDECGLVCLHAHVIELHNRTKFLQGSLQGVYLQIGWTGVSGQLLYLQPQLLLTLLSTQVCLKTLDFLGTWEGRELQRQLAIAYV
jgi:hypothetical protein